MTLKKKAVHFRKFLNAPDQSGNAFVSFNVENRRGYISADFSLRDCNDEAVLEFYVPKPVRAGKPRIENARAKIAALKEAIDGFEKAFEEAVIERDKSRRKTRKK